MTSSESQLPAPSAAPAPGEPGGPRVLASGHLHPAILVLRFVDGLRGAVVPILVGVLAQQAWLIAIAGVLFVLSMMHAIARYLTFQYRLTDEELILTEGILHRQERRIPVNRIQDLSLESTIPRRILGLVVVSVETASGHGAEARLDSLSVADAERLREALYESRRQFLAPGQPPPRVPEYLLHRASAGELMLLGLTSNRLGVILVSAGGLVDLADQFGMRDRVGGVFGGVLERLGQVHWALAVVVVLALIFVALLAGWVVSIAASLIMFFGFTLTLREDVLVRRYGLLTTRAAALPLRKIQRVLLEQTFLRRLVGLTVVRADTAGSGMDPREEARGGRDVIVPLATNARAEALVPVLLAGLRPEAIVWRRVSPRVVSRIFLEGAMLAAVVTSAAVWGVGAWGWSALVLLPLAWAVGELSYRNLAHAWHGEHLALRWGVLGRYRALVPLRKLQAVVVRRSPVERVLRLARLTVYVAGGNPTSITNLPVEEARRLCRELAGFAAERRFVW